MMTLQAFLSRHSGRDWHQWPVSMFRRTWLDSRYPLRGCAPTHVSGPQSTRPMTLPYGGLAVALAFAKGAVPLDLSATGSGSRTGLIRALVGRHRG